MSSPKVQFRSLGLQTNMIFRKFGGEVLDRGEYVVVRTPSRPGFFWGNFLAMRRPPQSGDFPKWIEIFEKEIAPRNERGFMAITWDDPDGNEGESAPFVDFGFDLSTSVVLSTTEVNPPPRFNEHLVIRPFVSDEDWDSRSEIHFDPEWEYGSPESQRSFLKGETKALRAMVDAGIGVRLGAFLDGRPIAELGVYWEGSVGRFNSVGTHRDFRRMGACGTLVYEASKLVLSRGQCKTLVMEADPEYHAAKIYESVGFKPTQKLCQLEWYDPKIIG